MAGSLRPSLRRVAAAGRANTSQESCGTALQPAAATSAELPFAEYDSEAEQLLLQLANQARSQAGVLALKLDPGLCRAAQAHAINMLRAHQLSHQFAGEPSLPQRLAAATQIQLDQEAENVALDYDPEDGHQHLMMSPPHRANLLNPVYNVIGIGVVHAGDRIYIVQDFARALPTYSVPEFKDQIAVAISRARHQARQPDLARLSLLNKDLPGADDVACSMAKADKLETSAVHQLAQHYIVLMYTTTYPGTIPSSAAQVFSTQGLHRFSLGACYARTETYPTGVYWVFAAVN